MSFLQKIKKRQEAPVRRQSGNAERPQAVQTPPAYRRNRTITDRSSVPEVSERAHIHQMRTLRKKVGMILGISIASLVVIIIGLSQFTGSVTVSVSDSTSLTKQFDQTAYQKYFDTYYEKYPFERFRFLTNYDQLSLWIQSSAPEVLSVVPAGIDSLSVAHYEIRFRQPSAGWRVGSQQFYVDTSGVTYTRNYFPEPTVTVLDHSGARVEQGEAIASSRLLSFVGRAVALAKERGVEVTQIEIPTQSMRQVYVYGKDVPIIRMTIDRGVEVQIIDMAKALAFFKAKGESPSYVDVRTSGKAFYQ